jgi:hypothetical protein
MKTFQEQIAEMKTEQEAWVKANMAAVRPGTKAVRMIDIKRPTRFCIVSRVATNHDQWRVTTVDEVGPWGHTTHKSLEAAIESYSGAWTERGCPDGSVGQYRVTEVR